MINSLAIYFEKNQIKQTLEIDTDNVNCLPYLLAETFAEIVRKSDAAPDVVVEFLHDALGLPDQDAKDEGENENENGNGQ